MGPRACPMLFDGDEPEAIGRVLIVLLVRRRLCFMRSDLLSYGFIGAMAWVEMRKVVGKVTSDFT